MSEFDELRARGELNNRELTISGLMRDIRGMNPEQAVAAVRAVLSDELRSPRYRGDANPMRGHCYVASEAVYHLLAGAATPMVLRHEGDTHWYLRLPDGTFVDPTADQFRNKPEYSAGRGCGFLTREPSRRARVVLARVNIRG